MAKSNAERQQDWRDRQRHERERWRAIDYCSLQMCYAIADNMTQDEFASLVNLIHGVLKRDKSRLDNILRENPWLDEDDDEQRAICSVIARQALYR